MTCQINYLRFWFVCCRTTNKPQQIQQFPPPIHHYWYWLFWFGNYIHVTRNTYQTLKLMIRREKHEITPCTHCISSPGCFLFMGGRVTCMVHNAIPGNDRANNSNWLPVAWRQIGILLLTIWSTSRVFQHNGYHPNLNAIPATRA